MKPWRGSILWRQHYDSKSRLLEFCGNLLRPASACSDVTRGHPWLCCLNDLREPIFESKRNGATHFARPAQKHSHGQHCPTDRRQHQAARAGLPTGTATGCGGDETGTTGVRAASCFSARQFSSRRIGLFLGASHCFSAHRVVFRRGDLDFGASSCFSGGGLVFGAASCFSALWDELRDAIQFGELASSPDDRRVKGRNSIQQVASLPEDMNRRKKARSSRDVSLYGQILQGRLRGGTVRPFP